MAQQPGTHSLAALGVPAPARTPDLLAAAASFLLGWGALAVRSAVAAGPVGRRGMWTYWSGAAGDLLLPGLLYGLLRARSLATALTAGACAPAVPGRWAGHEAALADRGTWAIAAAGALGGAASQAGWLADAYPQLNWLLIAPHRFSLPGWNQAAYLVAMSAAVPAAVWSALGALRTTLDAASTRAQARQLLSGSGSTAVMSAAQLFAATILADSAPTPSTGASRSTIAVILAAPASLLALAAVRLGPHRACLAHPLSLATAVTAGLLLTTIALA
jgi:hypothetical protein